MFFFFFNDTATTEIYTLSLHDALPISVRAVVPRRRRAAEILGDLTQVLRPLFDTHAGPVGDRCCVTLAQARDQHEVGTGGHRQEAGDPRCRHQGGHRDLHDGDVVGERRRHLGERAAQPPLREPARHEQHPTRYGFLRGSRHRGSPDRTNLFGVPSRAPPLGRHSTMSSSLRASSKSLSVIPPAAWFWSFTITRPHVTDRSG